MATAVRAARVLAAGFCMTVSACAPADPHEGFTAARSDDGPGFAWNRKPSLESCIHAGMPYAQFRRELISRGWEPMVDANCRANIVGTNSTALCAKSPDLCRVCDDLPELSLYARDGVALVWFRQKELGHELRASAFGNIADRHHVEETSRFKLVSWDIPVGR